MTVLRVTGVDCFGTRQVKGRDGGRGRLGGVDRCEGNQGENKPNALINFVF